ncbi:MAG: hypothetical protein WCW35_09085 [Bacteroidota bacterium]|jgi:Spy/CpxP family protein refolding chaperone
MKRRNLYFAFILALIISTFAVAQPRSGERGMRGEAQLKQLQEKIGLTEEQMVKVKAIMQKAREEARAEFENSDGDREAMREKMMKRSEQTDEEIMKLLTKEQKKKYMEYRKERQKEMQERMRERQ